jgi:hypothetical protein
LYLFSFLFFSFFYLFGLLLQRWGNYTRQGGVWKYAKGRICELGGLNTRFGVGWNWGFILG